VPIIGRPMPAAPRFHSTVAALAAGQLVCWAALFYTFSSLVLPMQRALGWTRPELMGAFTLGLTLWGMATYAVGAAIDRGHGRFVLTAGSVLGGIGFLGWSRVESLPALYAAWATMGIAMAMTLYEPAFNVLTRRFPDRFRQGIMALTLVGGFASTLAFPAAAWLIAQLEWRGALAAIGALLLVVIAPLHAWALRGMPAAPAAPRHPSAREDATLREALNAASFWFLTAAFALNSFAVAALFAHLMPAFAEKGVGEAQALVVVVCFGPAQVLGRFAWASLGSGRMSRPFALAVMAGMPLALAIFAIADRTPALILFSVLFGLSNGLLTILRGSLIPDYFGRNNVGRISGAMSSIALLARAAAPFAIAWLLVPLQSYRNILLLLSALGLGAVGAYALAGRPRDDIAALELKEHGEAA
jgi:MFS family permease